MHIIVLGGAGAMGRVTVRTLLVAPYSIRTILDEFTKQPQVFQDGNWYLQQPLSGQEEMVFPLPVGRATAIYSLHSECASFPVSFRDKGIRHVSCKLEDRTCSCRWQHRHPQAVG